MPSHVWKTFSLSLSADLFLLLSCTHKKFVFHLQCSKILISGVKSRLTSGRALSADFNRFLTSSRKSQLPSDFGLVREAKREEKPAKQACKLDFSGVNWFLCSFTNWPDEKKKLSEYNSRPCFVPCSLCVSVGNDKTFVRHRQLDLIRIRLSWPHKDCWILKSLVANMRRWLMRKCLATCWFRGEMKHAKRKFSLWRFSRRDVCETSWNVHSDFLDS